MIPAPQAPGSFAPAPEAKLPGKVGIVVGVVLIVAGVVLGVLLVVGGARSILSGVDDLQRVSLRDGGLVTLTETGSVSIYAERPSIESGTGFATGGYAYVPPVGIVVQGPDGVALPVRTKAGGETYHTNGREGVLIAAFDVQTPGVHRIQTILRGDPSPYTGLAVGDAVDAGGIVGIVGGIFGGGFVVLVGIVVLVISLVRRGRARRARRTPPWPGAGPGYGAGGSVGPSWAPPPTPYGTVGYGPPTSAPGGWGAPPAPAPSPGPSAPPSAPGWVPPPPPPAQGPSPDGPITGGPIS